MAATRTKTIEYAFALVTSAQTEGTSYFTSADITVFIPETTSRAFKSVIADITFQNQEATVADDLTDVSVGVSCNAGTNWTDTTATTMAVADTGENTMYNFIADVTAEFTARFGSGTSGTARFRYYAQFASTGETTTNVTVKLIITYEYDDTAHTTTRVKTVRIPIESINGGRLTTTLAELGTNQVPNLDTFLPEASKVYRNIFFELYSNSCPSGTTDSALALALDAEAEAAGAAREFGNSSAYLYRHIWVRNDMTTNATHALKARATATTSDTCLGGWLTVTYEYNESTSTTILNSIMIDLPHVDQLMTSSNPQRSRKKFTIAEPATITLKQSGVMFSYTAFSGGGTMTVKAGGQATRAYTLTGVTGMTNGMVMHRIDAGGAVGSAGVTLARGENTLDFDVYANATQALFGVNLVAIINYESGKASAGSEAHNKTLGYMIATNIRAATREVTVSGWSIPVIEASYHISSMFFDAPTSHAGQSGVQVSLGVQVGASEGAGEGWLVIEAPIGSSGGERLMERKIGDMLEVFRRQPNFNAGKLDVEAAHDVQFHANPLDAPLGGMAWVTYHSIMYNLSLALSQYTGDGSGITVDVLRADTKEFLGSVTTAAGGSASFAHGDNVVELFGVSRQSATKMGRTDNAAAA